MLNWIKYPFCNFLAGPVWFILCHFEPLNEYQHPKYQLNPFAVETFISVICIVVFLLAIPLATKMARPDMQQ
jgi:hypothetical protein